MLERRNWKRALISLALACLLAATGASSVAQDEDWHVTADVAESCSCDIACPCNWGSSPTHDYCHGNRLYQITKGHHGDTDVSGLEPQFDPIAHAQDLNVGLGQLKPAGAVEDHPLLFLHDAPIISVAVAANLRACTAVADGYHAVNAPGYHGVLRYEDYRRAI